MHDAKAHLFVQALPERQDVNICLGQFIFWIGSLSLWHCFSVVEMHPTTSPTSPTSPSGLGFSKLEHNQHMW